LSCGADKAFSATASGECATIKYAVGGVLSDAQSASIRLEGAEVRVSTTDGATVLDTDTAKSSGDYWVHLPVGTFLFTVKKEGYITAKRNVTILGYTPVGGAADMALSQVLGEGEWRVVVEWDKKSRDIDSHVFWKEHAQHVYWARLSVNDYASGIHVTLDRDDVSGYGPETVSFAGIGECKMTSSCLVKFAVDNYTPEDKCLGDSNIHVKLYKGETMDSEYVVPKCAGCPPQGEHYVVFTLDARVGHGSAHEGMRRLPPYLEGEGQVDWSQTFDTQMWNWAPTGDLIAGFRAQALAGGGGSRDDAPVYTHISLLDATVSHDNLAGLGPDSGLEELRYVHVGEDGDRTFDLVVTIISGDYAKKSAANKKAGDFGKINFKSCKTAEVDFKIVDAATGAPATISSFDVTFFDLDDWKNHLNTEVITISGYDEMIVPDDPWYTVSTGRDGSMSISANHAKVPNPSDPMTLTDSQLKAAVAFKFNMRSGFRATLGSICGKTTSDGRNLLFSFDSAMSPPDPGYQTALQYVHQIQYAKTVKVGGLSSWLDCETVDLDLTSVGWAACPAGRFLDGLYRVGGRYTEGEGVQQITMGDCCKAPELPAEWGECHEQDVFREANVMYTCSPTIGGKPTAVVGLHRGASHDTLDDIDKMRCCGFKEMELLPDGEQC
jgi:hypothetical protein